MTGCVIYSILCLLRSDRLCNIQHVVCLLRSDRLCDIQHSACLSGGGTEPSPQEEPGIRDEVFHAIPNRSGLCD